MPTDLKTTVRPEDTLELLDIRLGRILSAEPEPSAPKPSYRLSVDFGKYGIRTSVGRFTTHAQSDLVGRQVMGVLNFEPRQIGDVNSEVLIVGIHARGKDSGEATFLTPALEGKLGSKLF